MTTIGTSRSAVAYFLESLKQEAVMLSKKLNEISAAEMVVFQARVKKLTQDLPPLPNFSHFYHKFQSCEHTREGVMRDPFFLGYSEEDVEYIPLDDPRMLNIANEKRFVFSCCVCVCWMCLVYVLLLLGEQCGCVFCVCCCWFLTGPFFSACSF
jgi:hypothetical protein